MNGFEQILIDDSISERMNAYSQHYLEQIYSADDGEHSNGCESERDS